MKFEKVERNENIKHLEDLDKLLFSEEENKFTESDNLLNKECNVIEIINRIEKKIERNEYERKTEYGFVYEVNSNSEEPEVYLIIGKSKYEDFLAVYISPEEPRYNLILEEYGLYRTSDGIIFLNRSEIKENEKLKTYEEWDERFIIAHEMGHHMFREKVIKPAIKNNSRSSEKAYKTLKNLYELLHFAFQIRDFLNSPEIYRKLKTSSTEILNIVEKLKIYSREAFTFSMDVLRDLKVLDEAYAIIIEILTVLEYVKNNRISVSYATKFLNNQMEAWKYSYQHSTALNKIFDGFNENSKIWQLMKSFSEYNRIPEDDFVKELEQKREEILRDAKNELYKLPDRAGKKLEEMIEKKEEIQKSLEILKRELYKI
jgi:hypothetical protein